MSTIGNIIWFLLGGFCGGLLWIFAGIICCLTVIGIPLGLQCFKFAKLTMCPFGKDIIYGDKVSSLIFNIIWLLLAGLLMSAYFFIVGILYCVTIIGIPIGLYSFKMAKLSLLPFGAQIIN